MTQPTIGNPPEPIVFALPKGRLAKEVAPLLAQVGIEPEPAFFDDKDRRLRFKTANPLVDLIPVKPFDVATFVAHGGAQLGIVGADVLYEFGYSEVYSPVDLAIGHCRLSLAGEPDVIAANPVANMSHIKIATKYPNVTKAYFSKQGIQAECIKLNGSIELGPKLDMCTRIVDIVTTGNTLKANGLVEEAVLHTATSRLIVNRAALKTRNQEMRAWIDAFDAAVTSESGASK